jgi:hypothetical protein
MNHDINFMLNLNRVESIQVNDFLKDALQYLKLCFGTIISNHFKALC